ncbi:MAG: hypothetical protein GY762_16430 [Proteobacteria bacterium]|nr:hypothetical protein [Pseudomonadota bacterium]
MELKHLPLMLLAALLAVFFVACGDDCDDCDEEDAGGDAAVECSGCDANAHCVAGECVCNDGYKGDGASCAALSWDKITTGGSWEYYSNAYGLNSQLGHSCAIREGQLFCWGSNVEGQLGIGEGLGTAIPTRVGTTDDWTNVSAGYKHTCGIRSGELYCWGRNANFRDDDRVDYVVLGLGSAYDRTKFVYAPTQVGASSGWTQVAVGKYFGCAVNAGELFCWGRNERGNLAIGDSGDGTESDVPVQEVGGHSDWAMVWVSPWRANACGIRDDGAGNRRLYCWGQADNYGLGQGDTDDQDTPVQVPPLIIGDWTDWATVSTGSEWACGIRDDGTNRTLWCWGKNHWNGAGLPDYNVQNVTQVGTDTDWDAHECGRSFGCGIRGGALYCAGRNKYGQLGLGEDLSAVITCSSSDFYYYCDEYTLADDTRTWTEVNAGSAHTCGIAGGNAYCWGANYGGQAGQPTGDRYFVPTAVQ